MCLFYSILFVRQPICCQFVVNCDADVMPIWCQFVVKCDANMVSNVMSILDISKICSVYVIRIHIKKMKAKLEAKLEADYCPNTLRKPL